MGRPRKNTEIAATQLKPTNQAGTHRREPDTLDREALLGLSAKIAGNTICNRNWPYRNARKHFEISPLLRTVDKFYPWADGGPLYVDEPVTAQDEKECALKAVALKSEGLRYLVIKKDMTEVEARAQLEGA